MAKQFSAEFKMEAIKRVETSNNSIASVAKELGIKTSTLHGNTPKQLPPAVGAKRRVLTPCARLNKPDRRQGFVGIYPSVGLPIN